MADRCDRCGGKPHSWGTNWGGTKWGGTKWGPGTALLTWDDFDRLLRDQGEVCIPVTRGSAP